MSLKPADLQVADYAVALKPLVGYEQQLYATTDPHTVLGTLAVVAPNSGTYTPSVADNANLQNIPQELAVFLTGDVILGSACTVTVNGLDSNNAPVQGVAVFQPPGFAQDQTFGFPRGWGHELTTTVPGKKFKSILSVTPTYAGTQLPQFIICGLPTLDNTVNGTFRKIATKVSLNFDPKVPMPVAIQDGRDKGKYIKSGEIEIGNLEISAKIPSGCDGLARLNGRRVTGWVQELKEDKVNTQNILFLGLIMTAKQKVGESVEPSTLDATGMYEIYGFIMAH